MGFCGIFLLLSFVGCATRGPRVILNSATPEKSQELAQSPGNFSEDSRKQSNPVMQVEVGETKVSHDWLKNSRVKKWVDYFARRDSERFQRYLDRAEPYRRVVGEILEANGIPEIIFYLGVIESGYRTDARSHAAAVGVWQFIPATGKRYGLKIDSYVDERRDPMRSTEAAAKYLKDLYNVFNSWELALAAYNAGEGRILRAVMAGKSRDFWKLADKGVLPTETEDYVPKFLAASLIGENPELFGFVRLQDADHPQLALTEVGHSTRLSHLAQKAGINADRLVKFNPHLLRGVTPPYKATYQVWVPVDDLQKVRLAAGQIPKTPLTHAWARIDEQKRINSQVKPKSKKVAAFGAKSQNSRIKKYRVRPGDNLEKIADRFGVSVNSLKKDNQIRGSRIYAGEVLKIKSL